MPDADYATEIQWLSGKEYFSGKFIYYNWKILDVRRGIISYTVGQCRGLGIPASEPLCVIENLRKAALLCYGKLD